MAKKDFKTNIMSNSPAAAFLSGQSSQIPGTQDPDQRETKSVRVNLLVKPSTKSGIEKLATMDRTSMNSLINAILEEYLQQRSADLDKYDQIFKEWEAYKR